ncbi:MAG: hypothetical protein PVF96_01815 [Candidatus Bathyarchaeota archaeon]|jgi:hypothetical protein
MILGFAIFLGGFILGMLANALISVHTPAEIMMNIFILGLLIGMLIIVLILFIVKLAIFTKEPTNSIGPSEIS